MGNLSITPAIPAADGTGAGSDVSALGLEKTIYVDGVFTGAVTVEISNGNGYVPVATLTAPGRKTLKLAAENVRIVRSAATAVPGTPAVTISGNDDGAQFADLALGEPGASVDTKAFGTINTIVVDGEINGVVQIQTSEDDAVWTDLCAFQTPGHKTLEVVARYMRVNHVNNVPVTAPTVSVGAINDDTAHKPMLVLTSGEGSTNWDAGKGTVAHHVLDENMTMQAPINCEAGMVLEVIMEQGAGGNTVAWNSAWEFPADTDPVITAAAGAVDKIRGVVFTVDANGVATRILAEFAQVYGPV